MEVAVEALLVVDIEQSFSGEAQRCLRNVQLDSGSDTGGQRAAAIYTLIETYKLNDVDPHAWLADVLARVADHPAKGITDLLPLNWKATRLLAQTRAA